MFETKDESLLMFVSEITKTIYTNIRSFDLKNKIHESMFQWTLLVKIKFRNIFMTMIFEKLSRCRSRT
jgi:hypothetical protein